MTATGCTFKNSISNEYGGFISSFNSQFSLDSCEFENGKALKGGAIHYNHNFDDADLESLKLDIKNSKFTDNIADEGGALHLNADFRLIENV